MDFGSVSENTPRFINGTLMAMIGSLDRILPEDHAKTHLFTVTEPEL